MESEASDLGKLQLDHKNLVRDHEHLRERYEVNTALSRFLNYIWGKMPGF